MRVGSLTILSRLLGDHCGVVSVLSDMAGCFAGDGLVAVI